VKISKGAGKSSSLLKLAKQKLEEIWIAAVEEGNLSKIKELMVVHVSLNV